MADNKIEVEYITTVAGALNAIEKLNKRLDQQEQKLQKVGETSKKAADGAAGSFNKLEQELKDNEAALKRLVIGSRAFDEQRRKVDALRQSLNSAKLEMTTAGGAVSGALRSGVASITQMAAGLVGLQQIVASVVFELDKAKRMQESAATAQRSVEAAVAEMALNIGAENVPLATTMIREESVKLGTTQEGLANMLAGAISGGAKDLTEAMDLAAKTLKLTAGDAQKAGPIMSGMLSLAATTGNREWESTLGQLSQFQKAGRGEDFAMSINNMSTAIAAANTKGERIAALGSERTLELSAAISQLIQDPTMAVTGTTVRQLVSKMDAFVPKQKATLDDGTKSVLPKTAIDAFNQLGTLDERIAAMQANPELARQFLSTIEQNQGKAAIRQIVTGSDTAKQMIAQAEAIITPKDAAVQEYRNLTAVIGEQTQATRAENISRANIQAVETDQTTGRGVQGQVRKIVEDTLAKVNLSGLDYLRETEAAIALNQAQTPEAMIAAGIDTLESLQKQAKFGGDLIGGGGPVGGQVSEQDKRLMQTQIKLLEQIRDELQQRQPVRVNVAAPAGRPREAPLPAATVP